MPKQIKIVLGAAVLIVALGVVLFIAQPKSRGSNQPGDHNSMGQGQAGTDILGLNEKLHDFGTISMKNGKVTTIFTVQNTQNGPVTLKKLYTSCMCTAAVLKVGEATEGPFGMLGHGLVPTFNQVLQAGEQAEVAVTFDPNAHGPAGVGVIQRDVTLEGPGGRWATMQIKANVTP